MKRIVLCLLLLTTIIFSTFGVAFATEGSNKSIYASKSTQEIAYQSAQKETFGYYKLFESLKIKILKESITPVYTIDMFEFAKSGVMTLKLDVKGKSPSEEDKKQGNVYIAKLITEDGEYAGNIKFYIEAGVAYSLLFKPSMVVQKQLLSSADSQLFMGKSQQYMASCSYADHAERICKILSKDEFVSSSNVKFVDLDYLYFRSSCFFVQNGAEQIIIPVGYHNTPSSSNVDQILTTEEIKSTAHKWLNKHEEYLSAKEKWEKENPGEVYEVLGSPSAEDTIYTCGTIDNILNIAEYLDESEYVLNAETSDNKNENSSAFFKSFGVWLALLCFCVLAVGGLIFVYVRRK